MPDLLLDMQQAAERALEYTAGQDRASFGKDVRTQHAVHFNLVVLGEAAARVMNHYPAFAAAQAGVPWRAIRNMRNQVAHGYSAIDLDLVWNTVREYLPALLVALPAATQQAQQWPDDDAAPPPDPGA